MKKFIFTAAIATVITLTLAACAPGGAKQISLRLADETAVSFVAGERVDIVGDLDLSDAKIDEVNLVIEELAPGKSWTEFRKIAVVKGSSSLSFAIQKYQVGEYQYRAILSGKEYGPFTSSTLTVKYVEEK